MAYQVWDISTWAVMSQEARGLDPEDWVVPPTETAIDGQRTGGCTNPNSASYRRFDDWSEKMSAELARLLDLPAARVELAHGTTNEGIVSGNVTPNGWSMESGDTLLSEYEGYVSCSLDNRPSNRIGHNLENISRVLGDCAVSWSSCDGRQRWTSSLGTSFSMPGSQIRIDTRSTGVSSHAKKTGDRRWLHRSIMAAPWLPERKTRSW